MGVGEPGVQGGQAHLRAVADQEQQERGLQPAGIELAGVRLQLPDGKMDGGVGTSPRGDRQEVIAQERKAIPTEQIIRYFQVASRDFAQRWK